MIKKTLAIFMRDLKVSLKDFISLYIILFPILFALMINVLVPSLNDTTVNLGFINPEQNVVEYFEQFAKLEVFNTRKALDERILRRDAFFGLIKENEHYTLITQGNEPERDVQYAKLLTAFYQNNIN